MDILKIGTFIVLSLSALLLLEACAPRMYETVITVTDAATEKPVTGITVMSAYWGDLFMYHPAEVRGQTDQRGQVVFPLALFKGDALLNISSDRYAFRFYPEDVRSGGWAKPNGQESAARWKVHLDPGRASDLSSP